jgi:transposase-like protein
MKVRGQWRYLYRTVDKSGQTIDFLLTAERDEQAAKRFLTKAIRRHGVPEKITIDGSVANEAAIKRYNQEHGTTIVIRQVKSWNNMVKQDHRGVKRITRPMLGFKAFDAAQSTLVGIELMHMIKKRQMLVEKGMFNTLIADGTNGTVSLGTETRYADESSSGRMPDKILRALHYLVNDVVSVPTLRKSF